jgi:hypothetical protein
MNSLLDVFTVLTNGTAKFIDGLGGGVQILRSLGSVGMWAFSTQIAKGINTTITNIENANFKAEQFKASLASIEQSKAVDNPVTRSLLGNQEQLTRLSKFMTP